MARHSGEEAKGGSKLNIYTYNARGLRDKIKRARVFEYLKTKMSGIIFLQETHTVPGDQKVWEKEWQGEVMLSSGTSSARGVAILITKEVTCANIVIEADTNGRYILAKGEFDQQDITLLNVYAPTADKACKQQTFLDKLLPVLENNYENLVLGGDLNTYLEDIDKFGTSKTQSKFASRLKNIMSELQLIDIWRITHEDSKS
jgi:exonuclease III